MQGTLNSLWEPRSGLRGEPRHHINLRPKIVQKNNVEVYFDPNLPVKYESHKICITKGMLIFGKKRIQWEKNVAM